MHIAIGTTSLSHGLRSGHLDGIAIYTQELLSAERQLLMTHETSSFLTDFSLTPFAFSSLRLKMWDDLRLTQTFEFASLSAKLCHQPFPHEKSLKESGIDLFHATDHHIPKFKDIPVVATIMDAVPLTHPQWVSGKQRALKNWLFKSSAQWATHIITISQSAAEDIATAFSIQPERITSIPLGVDQRFFETLPEEHIKSMRRKYQLPSNFFLFLGTLQPRKNLKNILRAYKALPKAAQMQFPLVIAGREGWGVKEEIALLQQLVDEKKAFWLSYVSDIDKRALLQSATALVFPSHYEGFGLPVLEAFASSCPVICSNSSSLPEVCGSDAALLINPDDWEEILAAMVQIINNSDLKERLIAAGLGRAHRFTWQRTALQTLALYRRHFNL